MRKTGPRTALISNGPSGPLRTPPRQAKESRGSHRSRQAALFYFVLLLNA
jgi:hypothetical protein